ncbi:NfeD family protein [Acidithrix sp. C25]|uniref:NfeD family protein n=1 Tax=Acidithrix sp. C25 TaxID=1671482 RepID=UPI00191BAE3D|nr:NfeD family protein [Acidithrix sp. C25]
MIVVPLILLAFIVLIIAVGLHLGPHSSVGAGIASIVFAAVTILSIATSTSSISIIIYIAIFVIALGTTALGIKGILSKPKGAIDIIHMNLWGKTGLATTDLNPTGTVSVQGESWSAIAMGEAIEKGSKIFVVEADQIHLKVALDPLELAPFVDESRLDPTQNNKGNNENNN